MKDKKEVANDGWQLKDGIRQTKNNYYKTLASITLSSMSKDDTDCCSSASTISSLKICPFLRNLINN